MISFDRVDFALKQSVSPIDAAEAHGIAVGMLCIDTRVTVDDWCAQLSAERLQLPTNEQQLISELFEQTRALLAPEDEQFAFDLLLPDAEQALKLQAEALRGWCQGFLYGVGYMQSSAAWPGDSEEILQDIVEFTKMETETVTEEDAFALMELHEYLRSAVLMIRDQLASSAVEQLPH